MDNAENIMAIPSSLTMTIPAPAQEGNVAVLSIGDIKSYNFPCTKCGFYNPLSVIPSSETCACRYCGHKYSIFEVPKTIGVNSNFRSSFLSFDDETPAERRREKIILVGMALAGVVAIIFLGYIIRKHYARK